MQVILFESIEKLGMQGDLVNVAPGYFRNYLGPQGKAVEATEAALKRLELKRKRLKEEAEKQLGAAEIIARRLDEVTLEFTMKSPDGKKLFGSVHDHEILEQLLEQGFQIERRQILMNEPIKEAGDHSVKVRLLGRVEGTVTVTVHPEGGEGVTFDEADASASDGEELEAEEAEAMDDEAPAEDAEVAAEDEADDKPAE